MNKTDIKQIILEEIEATLEEMRMSPEMMAAQSFIDDEELDDKRAADAEGELEEMARTSNVFKISQETDLKQVLQFMQRVNNVLKTYKSPGQKRPKKRFTPEEIKALATAMFKPEGFTSKDVIAATSYSSPAQANKFLKALEMKGLITLTSQLKKAMEPTRDPNAPETRGRKRRDAEFDLSDDPMADLDALGLGGSIDLSDPLAEDAAEGLEAKSAGKKLFAALKKEGLKPVYIADITKISSGADASTQVYIEIKDNNLTISHPTKNREGVDKVESIIKKNGFNIKRKANNVGDFKLTEFDISITTSENKATMSELEKYIKKVIKEAKNPLAKKMKEIENQGRRAALETKLAAIDEMIEETQGRLTRIDEDNEFRDMMDKNAVKEVRKQLKELERAKAKLQKEYGKMKKMALPKNYDEDEKGKVMDEEAPVAEDTIENAVDEVELEEDNFKLNESTLRFQKLAGLITESDIRKKLSLNESREKLMSMLSGVAKDMVEDGSLLPENPGGGPFNVTGNSEGFEPRQIAAHNQIKDAVEKLGGSVNYKVDGLSFTYMVKGDDLFVRTDD